MSDREPGPMELARQSFEPGFAGVPPYAGIQTFLKLPLCLTPADLRAGEVDIAIGGAPWDGTNTIRGGTHLGPLVIRACDNIWTPPLERPHLTTRVDGVDDLVLADYGDSEVVPGNSGRTFDNLRKFTAEILEADSIPIILGGDHSITWPIVETVADVHGRGKVGVIQFDAHADCTPMREGDLPNHGNPMWQLIDGGAVNGKDFVQIGLRGYYPTLDIISWMEAQGLHTHYMEEVEEVGINAVVDRAIEELQGVDKVYITLDVDGIDPAFAPGTGSPEPGGLTSHQILRAVRRLAAELEVVGMDVVEVSPPYDTPNNTTAVLAHRCVLEAVTGIGMRRRGLTESNYRHPEALGSAD